jgi:putative ABC transport system permease protein
MSIRASRMDANNEVRTTGARPVTAQGLMARCAASLRYATRSLRRSSLFATSVILSLGLGVGVNISIFSIVNAVLLRPLPFARADQLAVIGLTDKDGVSWHVPPRLVESWLKASRPPVPIAVIAPYSGPLRVGRLTEYVDGAHATPNLLSVLGLSPERGRWFVEEDLSSGAPRAMVISHEFWRSQLALDPNALGRTVHLFDQQWTIIGIMPPGLTAPIAAPFWIPGEGFDGRLIARLANDTARLALARYLDASVPAERGRLSSRRPVLVGLREHLYGGTRPALRLLAGAAFLLLIVSCLNIANLALARGVERQHAMAVRAALGASRRDLAAAVVAENALLAIAGGLTGVVLALWTTQALMALSPAELALPRRVHMDATVAAFAALLVAFTIIGISVGPVLSVSRVDLGRLLSGGGSRIGSRTSAATIRRGLVIGQLSVALVLTIVTALFLRSLSRLLTIGIGFNSQGVVTATMNLMATGSVLEARDSQRILQRISGTLSSYPGVQSVGFGPAPLTAGRAREVTEGADMIWFARMSAEADDSVRHAVWIKFVDAGYLATFRIPILSGRNVEPSDDNAAPAVAVLNATAARLLFPRRNAIGQPLSGVPRRLSGGRELRVVGVAGDSRQRDLRVEPEPEILVPIAQQASMSPNVTLSARSAGNLDELISVFRRTIADGAPDLPVLQLRTMSAIIDQSLLPERFLLTVIMILALLAVSIASIGLYAIVAFLAAQRTREFGVRMAMGATSTDVMVLVAREGLSLVIIGALIGALAAYAFSRMAVSLLYDVSATDFGAYVGAAALFGCVALLASLVPASRAARVDPTQALRQE